MATITTIRVVDDLTGGEAVTTRVWQVGGRAYSADLNEANALAFDEAFRVWSDIGREVTVPSLRSVPGAVTQQTVRRPPRDPIVPKIRAWARAAGWQVSDRGRVPADVRAAYAARDKAA